MRPMTFVAAKEIRDKMGPEHAKACSSLTGAGADIDKLIMRTSEFESKDAELIRAEVASVRSGLIDFERGRWIDARELSRKIRTRFDLCD